MELSDRIPARVIRAITPAGLRDLIPADLGVEPFIWPAEISNNNLDFYFCRMAESTLRNFAADSTAGVTFLDSHDSSNLGYGRSLSGVFEAAGEGQRTIAYFYTVPGIKLNGGQSYASTDDFILAVRSGLASDVSVGVYGGERICDICGKDIYSFDWNTWEYECPHIPGVEYPTGDRGESTILATFAWENGRLAEVSAVYDGATPGAAIIKATRMIESVEVPPMVLHQLETKYHMKMPEKRFVIAKPEKKTERKMDELEQIQEVLAETEAAGETPTEQVRWLIGEVSRLKAESVRLATKADEGDQYRQSLIDEALTEGVRVMGNGFPRETYEKIFERSSLAEIRTLKNQWQAQADNIFPQCRQTAQEDETQPAAAFDLLKLPKKTDYSVHN